MTDYPLKTPGELAAVSPALQALLMLWQDGALKTASAEDILALATKAMVGLANVNDTSDADKPVSIAQAEALAGKQAADPQLSTLAGLTGIAGAFTRWTGADTAVMQAIVGTVSQAAGTPTGAIVERGSNANGDYVRFADGTQICWHTSATARTTSSAVSGVFIDDASGTALTFPAAFAAAPQVIPVSKYASISPTWAGQNSTVPTASACNLRVWGVTSTAQGFPGYLAIGRWF